MTPFLVLAACALASAAPPVATLEDPDFEAVLEAASVECGQDHCPESVGMVAQLLGRDSRSGYPRVGRCTGFLVAPGVVATNRHCVNSSLIQENGCASSLAIKFPETRGKPSEIRWCSRMLRVSDPGSRQDYAFFEVDRASRAHIEPASDGVPGGRKLRWVGVVPLPDGAIGGKVMSASVETVQGSFLEEGYQSPWDQVGLAVGYQAIPGNSGSPLLDEASGRAVGIVHGHAARGKFERSLVTPREGMPPHLLFTNLSCLRHPVIDHLPRSRECGSQQVFGRKRIAWDAPLLARWEIGRHLDAWRNALPPVARYEISWLEEGKTARARPRCLLPRERWPRSSGSDASRYERVYERTITASVKPVLDSWYRWTGETRVVEDIEEARLGVELSGGSGPQRAYIEPEAQGHAVDPERFELPWCSAADRTAGNRTLELEKRE